MEPREILIAVVLAGALTAAILLSTRIPREIRDALEGSPNVNYQSSSIRGIRNNNPGNLRPNSSFTWRGQVGSDEGPGGGYLVFDEPLNGLRASMINLLNYEKRYGINTPKGIGDRWAPVADNNPETYGAFLASKIGKGPMDEISVDQYLIPLMHAITLHENGIDPYPEDLYEQAARLARSHVG